MCVILGYLFRLKTFSKLPNHIMIRRRRIWVNATARQ